MEQPEKEYLSVSESGRLGGLKTRAKYGREHYEEIGRKGGLVTQSRNRKVKPEPKEPR